MQFPWAPRRGTYIDISEVSDRSDASLTNDELAPFETLDLIYRTLCGLMYNYVPMSGHPGGSISSGRFVAALLFDAMDYDVGDPDRAEADVISYAAGHKALGLYAMWALRDELTRVGDVSLLPRDTRYRLRLEDLLGFRRNPVQATPLFLQFKAKALDGHPTPATPFVRLSTGASGVGVPASLGLALAARDYYGNDAPRVHIVEGEGGLTPGRVAEALAAAGTAGLDNAVLHLDWNQASIDSNKVCREGGAPGDYVQWNPMELAYLNDWNVVYAPDGRDFRQVLAAQRHAATIDNGQPTAIVYRTVKGWQYGIEGRASHGAGHKLCSDGFYEAMMPLLKKYEESLPYCSDPDARRCETAQGEAVMEECFWSALETIRRIIEREPEMVRAFTRRLVASRDRLAARGRAARDGAPRLEAAYELAHASADKTPEELTVEAGSVTTLRAQLGKVLNHYNKKTNGAFLVASADLAGSTSVDSIGAGFGDGFYNARSNSGARLLSIGGICEDAISGYISGLSTYGRHIGVASSYGAFLAALGHIASRLHAIGGQARWHLGMEPYRPMILVCAHAGLKTGEDGPTHADPQPLQLLQGNFPRGTAITLTPWEPQEVWHLVSAALAKRPALIAPFVTRPGETVPDREAIGLAPAEACVTGVYALRKARGAGDGTVVLQGSGVTLAFVEQALPRLLEEGIDLNVYYVASEELFDLLPEERRREVFPGEHAEEAMGITGFTLPTMYRWVRSERGRSMTLHPFAQGHFLGSGPASKVLEEAGLDGESQYRAVSSFVGRAARA
jgi:transketolase